MASSDQYLVTTYDGSHHPVGPCPRTRPNRDGPCRTRPSTSPARHPMAGWRFSCPVTSASPGWSVRASASGTRPPAPRLGGTPLDLPPGAAPSAFSFSSYMRYLAGSAPTDQLLVWDLNTGHLTVGSTGALNEVNAITFDPGRPGLLAIGETDGQLRFYDVTTDQNVQPPVAALAAPVVDLEFSADGSTLVGISQRGLIGVWRTPGDPDADASPRPPRRPRRGTSSGVGCSSTRRVRGRWSNRADPGATGVPIVFDVRGPDGAAQSATAAMSADGSTVVAETSSPSGVSTLVTDVDLNSRWELPEPVSPMALSPDGTHLVAVDDPWQGRWLSVWDLAARTMSGDGGHLRARPRPGCVRRRRRPGREVGAAWRLPGASVARRCAAST